MDVATEKTIIKAFKASLKDGRLRFIFGTAYGPKISLCRVTFQDCIWVNGYDAGTWETRASGGRTDEKLSRSLKELLGSR